MGSLLRKVLGEYFDGLDSEGLQVAIWSGEVTIKNLSLKPQALDLLGLPFKLLASHVGKLVLNIPWKSLGSQRIEVTLEGLHLLVMPKKRAEWVFVNHKLMADVQRSIEQCASALLKKYSENIAREQDKEDTFTQKLTLKIIDNMQLEVRNIHLRLEHQDYSAGLVLQELTMFTVDQHGQPSFVDRKEMPAGEPLRKRVKLSNFGLYWHSDEKTPLNADPRNAKRALSDLVFSPFLRFLFRFSCEVNLLQRDSKEAVKPELALEVSLPDLHLTIENKQLQQMVALGELHSNYVLEMRRETLRNIVKSGEELARVKDEFE